MTVDFKKIKFLREQKKYTVRELAERSGVHRNTLHDIENGRKSNITLDTVNKIAKALEIEPQELFLGGE